jgi:hypothetical protein
MVMLVITIPTLSPRSLQLAAHYTRQACMESQVDLYPPSVI